LEDNYVLKALAGRVLGTEKLYGFDATPDGYQDDLLLRADKTPNRTGVRYLGINDDRAALLSGLKGAQVALVMANNLAQDAELAAALKAVPTVIYLATHADETVGLAHYVFPVAMHAEKYGSFVNFQGRVQRFYQAFEAQGDAVAEMEFLSKLGRTIDAKFGYDDIEEIWVDMRQTHTELGELGWYKLGDEGFQIPSLAAQTATV
jgi:NADH dehydrogenase/NADH:ubiquinone oxidoreductase subunit G